MNSDMGYLVHLLKNTPVQEIIHALERDNFYLRRETRTGGRIYVNRDDNTRRVVIHYHHGNDTLTRKTLKNVLEATHWIEEDLKRLKLIK